MAEALPATAAPPVTRWRDVLGVGAATIQGRAVIAVGSNHMLVSDRVHRVLDHLLLRNPSTAQDATLAVLREVVTLSDAASLYRRLQDLQRTERGLAVVWRNWRRGWVTVPLWHPRQGFVDALRGRVLTPLTLTAWAVLCAAAILSLAIQPLPRLVPLVPWQWAVLWAMVTVTTAIHEFGHLSVAAHNGLRTRAVGLGLLYLQPSGYAEVSDSWLVARSQRIAIALGGMLFQSVPVIVTYGVWRLTGTQLAGWYVIFNLVWMASNLVPFIRLDGYWVLSFALDEFNLRQRSYAQLLHLVRIGNGPAPWSGPQGLLWAVFAVLSAMFTVGLYASILIVVGSLPHFHFSPLMLLAWAPVGLTALGIMLVRRRRARQQEPRT